MSDIVRLDETPQAERIDMIVGWRQWADAGSISSGLPEYLVKKTKARRIGSMNSERFYLFQIPGTHDLVRPMVQFEDGYPKSLERRRNEFFYGGDAERGLLFFSGDEPHLDAETYIDAILDTAKKLGVQRIISFGGVYGELPYDKERMVSAIYSLPKLRPELDELAVNFSDYAGGASIGSYLCKRASEREQECVGFFSFIPNYDFSSYSDVTKAIRIENDYMAWLGVMKRVKHMLKYDFDLDNLEKRSERLVESVEEKINELDEIAPQLDIREHLARISDQFDEVSFDPLADVWEDEINRLLEDGDEGES